MRYRWIYPSAVAGLIVFGSGQSHVPGPDVAGLDKVVHLLAFGLLATAIYRLLPRRMGWLVVLVVSLFGASDEWHQSFTVGRSVEVADWVADTLGGAIAVVVYRYWTWYRNLLEWNVLALLSQRRIDYARRAGSTQAL